MSKNKALSFKYLLHDFILVSASPGLLWFRPKKLYPTPEAKKPMKGGTLLVSNHIGLFDPMFLMLSIWKRRHHFVAMTQLFKGKVIRWLFTYAFLCIEIDRDNFSMKSFNDIVNHLKDGDLVSLFPEGHVNVSKEGTDTFKSGMILMAYRAEVPIIPVYIRRRKHFYSRLIVGVGEPIDIKGYAKGNRLTMTEVDELTNLLQEKEKELETLCLNYKKKK